MNYTENELQLYCEFMSDNTLIINNSSIPNRVKQNMINGRGLMKKDNDEWYFQDGGYRISIKSFTLWLKCKIREQKLNQLLNG